MDRRSKFIFYGIAIGSVSGIAAGLIFGHSMVAIAWIGKFFLNSLKMTIIPLVMFSMINGMAGLSTKSGLGKIGFAFAYYISTTFIAVAVGLILVNIVNPGIISGPYMLTDPLHPENITPLPEAAGKVTSVSDLFLHFVSPNIIGSMAHMDLLPVIIFSLLFGFALNVVERKGAKAKKDEKSGSISRAFATLNDAILEVVQIILWISPLGVFSLIAAKIGSFGPEQLWQELGRLAWYVFTVLAGLAIHGFVVLPVILMLFSKRNPLLYFKNMLSALLTAFSTASSSATLPVTIKCAEENNAVSPQSAGLVLPLGATINMDGTALYEAVAAMFIAQVYGIQLGFFDQLVIFFTATLAAIGAAGIPEAGLVTMAIVLGAVKLPLEGITLLLTIDWLLDRFRTTINVWGDAVGAAVVEKFILPKK